MKDISSFIKFDIVDFYPFISKDLLINAINFAKSITSIDDKTINIIKISIIYYHYSSTTKSGLKKAVLIFVQQWLVLMVWSYLLDILRKRFGDNKIGLYRYDGLSCFQNLSNLKR